MERVRAFSVSCLCSCWLLPLLYPGSSPQTAPCESNTISKVLTDTDYFYCSHIHTMCSDHPPSTPISHVTTIFAPSISGTSPSSPIPPSTRSPRINLRPLASYYTLTYIFLIVLVAWLLSIPLWLDFTLLLVFLFIFCCISLLVYGPSPQETRKMK